MSAARTKAFGPSRGISPPARCAIRPGSGLAATGAHRTPPVQSPRSRRPGRGARRRPARPRSPSMMPNFTRSCAVIFMLVAASWARDGVAPQDRGRGLGRGDRVDRMFEHQHLVGGGDGDRAARAALADDDGDIGDAELEAGVGRPGDGLRLAALLGVDSREGARRCRPAPGPAGRTGPPVPSAARPCDSPPAAPCRNCA